MPTCEEELARLRKELDQAHAQLHGLRNRCAKAEAKLYLIERRKRELRDTDPDEVGYA